MWLNLWPYDGSLESNLIRVNIVDIRTSVEVEMRQEIHAIHVGSEFCCISYGIVCKKF